MRDLVKLLESDGWYLSRIRGSQKQYKHRKKTGLVTLAGKSSDDVAPAAQHSVAEQAELKE
jgi:predicted RNA binding protein YcfA (HicA-like mRNA interferase family)